MEQPKTLSAALCCIYTSFGLDIMKNSDKIVAYFADIAPKLKNERMQLEVLVKSGCIKKLSDAHGKSAAEMNSAIAAATDTLCNTYFMEKSKADYLCRTYVYALSGRAYTPSTGTNATVNAGSATATYRSKPATPTTQTTKTTKTTSTSKTTNTAKVTDTSKTTIAYTQSSQTVPHSPTKLQKVLLVIMIILLPFILYFLIGSLIHGDVSGAFGLTLPLIAIIINLVNIRKNKKKK